MGCPEKHAKIVRTSKLCEVDMWQWRNGGKNMVLKAQFYLLIEIMDNDPVLEERDHAIAQRNKITPAQEQALD